MFTDDGAFIVRIPGRPLQEIRGRAELDERFGKLPARGGSLPMTHNLVISIEGDTAIAYSSIEIRMIENGQSMIASGYYEDSLRRVKDEWKFVVRDNTSYHLVPHLKGWAAAETK